MLTDGEAASQQQLLSIKVMDTCKESSRESIALPQSPWGPRAVLLLQREMPAGS